ncbi:unnamed protein product [Parnassius apollo]|uniref:(apollo) hypothetical protein n=1 Tax=Parnassius apollo TaxID=110799 RepID=A0A8S3WNN6_PARAO|nr:unnamed protein product [Parnassius apollo]
MPNENVPSHAAALAKVSAIVPAEGNAQTTYGEKYTHSHKHVYAQRWRQCCPKSITITIPSAVVLAANEKVSELHAQRGRE